LTEVAKMQKNMRYMGTRSVNLAPIKLALYNLLLVTNSNFGCISQFPSFSDRKVKNRLSDTHVSFDCISRSDPLQIC